MFFKPPLEEKAPILNRHTQYNSISDASNQSDIDFAPDYNQASLYQHRVDFVGEQLKPDHTKIYIWNSNLRQGSVGHIAIAFNCNGKSEYISFWPKQTPAKKFLPEDGNWHERLDDLNAEKSKFPDYVIELEGLDTKKMYKKFNEVKDIAKKWNLLASTPLKGKSFNCIGVAIEILKAGGLEELAKEEIIKQQRDELDKGVLPYRQKPIDKGMKACVNLVCCCIGSLMACYCVAGILFTVSAFLMYLFSRKYYKKMMNDAPKDVQLGLILPFIVIGGICICCAFIKKCIKPSSSDNQSIRDEHIIGLATDASEIALISSTIAATAASNTVQFPWDTVRGLIEYTLVPDGRIKIILEKAKTNEEQSRSKIIKIKKEIILPNSDNNSSLESSVVLSIQNS